MVVTEFGELWSHVSRACPVGGALREAVPSQQLLKLDDSHAKQIQLSQYSKTKNPGMNCFMYGSAVYHSNVVKQPENRKSLKKKTRV